MEILNINSQNEIILKVNIEELNNYITSSNLNEYDRGFNKGWEMAENEYANANK